MAPTWGTVSLRQRRFEGARQIRYWTREGKEGVPQILNFYPFLTLLFLSFGVVFVVLICGSIVFIRCFLWRFIITTRGYLMKPLRPSG